MNNQNYYNDENYTEEPGSEIPEPPRQKKKLTRSVRNQIFLGLCGGLGSYFGVSPYIFRILFIVTLLLGSWGMLLYIILSIITPLERTDNFEESTINKIVPKGKLFGFMLIILGLFLFLDNMNLSGHFNLLGFRQQYIFPLLIVLCLIYLVLNSYIDLQNNDNQSKLSLSSNDKILAGVCSGFSNYLNINPFLTRGIFLFFSLITFGTGIIIYAIFFILLRKRKENINAA